MQPTRIVSAYEPTEPYPQRDLSILTNLVRFDGEHERPLLAREPQAGWNLHLHALQVEGIGKGLYLPVENASQLVLELSKFVGDEPSLIDHVLGSWTHQKRYEQFMDNRAGPVLPLESSKPDGRIVTLKEIGEFASRYLIGPLDA